MIINIYTLIQINKTVTFNSKHAWSTPWSPSRASINVMNPPTRTNQCFVLLLLFFFILNWGWETSQNCHPLHVFSPLPLSPPCSPPVLREKLHPAHMFFIRAQLRLTCHTSTRWTLPGFDILCVSHTWLTLHGFDQLSPLLNTSPELISQPGSEREWEKGCGLSFSVVTHWNFFFFFGSESCVNVWACDSRVQLEWNVFFFVLFPTKAHHYDFFNRKTFYSCCFDASSWQTSDWCYFSWMFSEDGGVLGVVMLGQQKSPLTVPHFKSAKKTCRRKPKWDRSSDSCSGLTWASSLGGRGGGVYALHYHHKEKRKKSFHYT